MTEKSTESGSTIITVTSDGDLNGFQIAYDTSEPITPYLESSDEIPPLVNDGIIGVGLAANLQPPTVFNNPVTLTLPCPGEHDVRDLRIFLYNGAEWVYASSSYNTGGVVQPEGEGWIVPGSLKYYESGAVSSLNVQSSRNATSPPALEVQVYHFSAIQAAFVAGSGNSSAVNGAVGSGGGGGCFISTLMGWGEQ